MNRTVAQLAAIGTLAVGLALAAAPVLEAGAADLPRSGGNNRDGVEVARGDDGDTYTYTVNETADTPPAGGPVAPAAPDLSRVPTVVDDAEPVLSGPPTEPAPVTAASEPAPVETSNEVTAPVVSDAPVTSEAPVSADPAPVAVAVAACGDFATWYDAQIYYESLGTTAAAPDVVGSLDPDYDGVACEEMMQTYQ